MNINQTYSKAQLIWHYLWQNKRSYGLAILFIFLVNWLQVEIPRFVQQAIDLMQTAITDSHAELMNNVWIIIVASIVLIVIRTASRIYGLNPGRFVEAQLKNDLFFKLNRLTDAFHSQNSSGKLISIINNDITGIRLFFGIGFMQLFNIIFALSLTPIYMWRISPSLTLYSLIPIAIAFVIYRMGFVRMRKMWTDRMHDLQALSEKLVHYLSGMDVIKAEHMGPWVEKEMAEANQQLLDVTIRIQRIQVFIMPVLDYANQAMKILILGMGGWLILQQELTVGEITAFLSYSVMLAMPFMGLGRILTIMQMGMVSIESVMTILNANIDEKNLQRLSDDERAAFDHATLEVKQLQYTYQQEPEAEPALKNITFALPSGKKLGILGAVGSGKTTLVNCLNHLLDIEPNQVFYGGVDITQWSRHDWHQRVRTITQDPYLFSASLADNIHFGTEGKPHITPLTVDEALEAAQLKSDVERFSQQENTLVGEKGIMLSGGQKQRVSIARALFTPADILILDNVLSAVDYDTERAIMGSLNERLAGRSLIVVSHRISALQDMDEILVLKEGQVIDRGTHPYLLANNAYYQQTWQLQQNEQEGVS